MQFSGNLLHLAYNRAINVTQGLSGPALSEAWSSPCARYRHLVRGAILKDKMSNK